MTFDPDLSHSSARCTYLGGGAGWDGGGYGLYGVGWVWGEGGGGPSCTPLACVGGAWEV